MMWCGYNYTTLGELRIYSRIVRSSMCLPENERLVLLFILDRTVGWHRVWETISLSQFANGVNRHRGGSRVVVSRGTRLSPSEVTEALERLESLGAITADHWGPELAFKINENWLHPDLRSLGMWELSEEDFDYETGAVRG